MCFSYNECSENMVSHWLFNSPCLLITRWSMSWKQRVHFIFFGVSSIFVKSGTQQKIWNNWFKMHTSVVHRLCVDSNKEFHPKNDFKRLFQQIKCFVHNKPIDLYLGLELRCDLREPADYKMIFKSFLVVRNS